MEKHFGCEVKRPAPKPKLAPTLAEQRAAEAIARGFSRDRRPGPAAQPTQQAPVGVSMRREGGRPQRQPSPGPAARQKELDELNALAEDMQRNYYRPAKRQDAQAKAVASIVAGFSQRRQPA